MVVSCKDTPHNVISDESALICKTICAGILPLFYVYGRIYGVDRSRSRQVGGTAWLSIVKRSAAFHNATVDIESEEGRGTAITVTFLRLRMSANLNLCKRRLILRHAASKSLKEEHMPAIFLSDITSRSPLRNLRGCEYPLEDATQYFFGS